MSGHTRRLTQSPTRTTPGSYEAPVEGIVDYGAFGRGFEKGIAPGLAYLAENAKEEEMPDLITLEDFDYTGTASKSGALGVSTEASNSMNLGIDNKIRDIQARLDSAVVRKDVNLQRDIMREYNTLKKVVAGAQTAFNGIAGAEGAIDARQAIDKKIGRNTDGKGLSWYEISTIGNQKDSAFEFVTNANGTGGLRVNGYYFDTTSINENTVSKITPLTGGLNAAIKDYSSKIKAPEVEKNQVQYDQNGKTITSQRISQNSYDNMEEAADKFSQTVLDNKATFQANYLDSLYGVNKSISENPSEFFKGIAIEDNVGSGKKYKTEQDYIAAIEKGEDTYTFKGTSFADFASGNGSEQSVQGLIKKYGSNHYKLTQGSEAYAANDYGVAVEKDNLFKSATIQPKDDGSGSGSRSAVGIVEDLNTQFNAITSDAEREFGKPEYKAGTKRSGQEQAPQMFNFLTNKSYMKGGSEKSIDNVEYRIVGEGKNRKILLDIFSTSAGQEDKLATVDLGDTIARRDFLTNIGQGLAVTSSEKQAVRDETTALTQSREVAFEVFKGLNIGGKNSSRWNVLAKALRNNSSEGLSAEERKAFLKAGYGKQ